MKHLNLRNPVCLPSLKLLGDFWTLRIIDALDLSQLRYSELNRAIDGINTVTLCSRLKRLEEFGLIERTELSRSDVTYRLTRLGLKVLPVLDSVNDFATATKRNRAISAKTDNLLR